MTEDSLRRNLATPRSWTGLAWRRFVTTWAISAVVLGTMAVPVHPFLRGLGLSIAGPVVCAVQCPEGGPHGRSFDWSFRGHSKEKKGQMGNAFVCRNPVVDVDRLTVSDVRSEPLNTKLQPYIVHQAWLIIGDPLAWGLLLAVVAVLGTSRALRRLDEERTALELKQREG